MRVEREIDWLRCQPFQRDVSEAFRPYAANSIRIDKLIPCTDAVS